MTTTLTTTSLTLPSFSKINWILKILGKRPDGYHEVRTILQTIDLADEIRFEAAGGTSIDLEIRGLPVSPGSDNLIHRAADLVTQRTGKRRALKITLRKRIPMGAGLGGGSGNAAVTLLALNQLWECRLKLHDLVVLAAELGSDIPFFLLGGTAFASGRGEKIVSFAEPPREAIVVVYPAMEVASKEAYSLGNWGSWEETAVLTTLRAETRINRFRKAIEADEEPWSYLENDFEAPIFRHYPALTEIRAALEEAGCRRTLLCGSGSALFGLVESGRAGAAAETISERKLGEVFLCRTVSHKQYGECFSGPLAYAG